MDNFQLFYRSFPYWECSPPLPTYTIYPIQTLSIFQSPKITCRMSFLFTFTCIEFLLWLSIQISKTLVLYGIILNDFIILCVNILILQTTFKEISKVWSLSSQAPAWHFLALNSSSVKFFWTDPLWSSCVILGNLACLHFSVLIYKMMIKELPNFWELLHVELIDVAIIVRVCRKEQYSGTFDYENILSEGSSPPPHLTNLEAHNIPIC